MGRRKIRIEPAAAENIAAIARLSVVFNNEKKMNSCAEIAIQDQFQEP